MSGRPTRALSLAACAAVVCAACSSGGDAAPPRASTTVPAPTSTTEAAPQYSPSPYSWDRSASAALALGGGAGATLSAIIAPTLNQPWIVFGTRTSASGIPTATEWTSTDGASWTSTALTSGGEASSAVAAAQYRGETVVVGSVGMGANRQAAAWLSATPGAPFTSVGVPLTDGPSNMTEVAAGALGLFATGTVDGRFALWSSTDGRSFGEQPDAEKIITSDPGTRVSALLAEGDTVYAGGSTGSGAATAAAAWSTADGLHWHAVTTAVNAFTGPGAREIYSLAPLGTGIVAVGAVNRGSGWVPASWVSPDGASWSPPSTDLPGVPAPSGAYGPSGGAAALSVAPVATFAGTTAVVAAGGGPSGQVVWRSTDGLHWTQVPLPGADATAGGWRATLVAGTIDSTVIADGQPGQPHVLTDAAGAWSEPSANPAVFGPVRPEATPVSLEPVSGRLDMVVRVETGPQAIGAPAISYATLSSANGSDWSAVAGSAAQPPTLPTAGAIAIQVPGGWAAVGEAAPERPEAWSSPDGRTWTAEGLLDSSAPPVGSTTAPTTAPTSPALSATVNGVCVMSSAAGAPTGPAGQSPAATSTTVAAGAAAGTTTVVAVGSALMATASAAPTSYTGRQAVAWVSENGSGWKRATISPAAAPGGIETMSGCARTASGLVAWGMGTGAGGTAVPAVWRSATGTTWSRVNAGAFTPGTPAPITALAVNGNSELAVANPDPAAGPTNPSAPIGAGPAATAATDAATGPGASFENGLAGLWLSADGGNNWQALDTAAPPWLGTEESAASLVAFAGSDPVVAGTADGGLVVWTGSPASPPGGSGSASTSSTSP